MSTTLPLALHRSDLTTGARPPYLPPRDGEKLPEPPFPRKPKLLTSEQLPHRWLLLQRSARDPLDPETGTARIPGDPGEFRIDDLGAPRPLREVTILPRARGRSSK